MAAEPPPHSAHKRYAVLDLRDGTPVSYGPRPWAECQALCQRIQGRYGAQAAQVVECAPLSELRQSLDAELIQRKRGWRVYPVADWEKERSRRIRAASISLYNSRICPENRQLLEQLLDELEQAPVERAERNRLRRGELCDWELRFDELRGAACMIQLKPPLSLLQGA